MHTFFKCKVFRQGQGYLGRDQALHHRVIGQVDEHGHVFGHAALLKGTPEEISHIILNAHGPEHNRKLLIRIIPQGCLLHNLGGQLVVGKSVAREDRQFLSPYKGCKPVNGRDTRADIVPGVLTCHRV